MNIRRFAVLSLLLVVFAFGVNAQENCKGSEIFSSSNCTGDTISNEEKALFDAVNAFRAQNGMPALRSSASLSRLGNRRMLDLNQNMKSLTHSWSNCPYEIGDEKTWPCLINAPRRLNSGYSGEGYETLFRTSKPRVIIDEAIAAWKKSSLHSSIILNKGDFAGMPWEEFGVAIDGHFAALWFGYSKHSAAAVSGSSTGVSLETATAGLAKSVSISQAINDPPRSTWQGFTQDKKLRLTIAGKSNDVSDAEITVVTAMDGVSIEAAKRAVMLTLLRNIFPEWADVDDWLNVSLKQIIDNRTAFRRKTVRGLAIEIKADGPTSIKLQINAPKRAAPIEMD